MDPTARRKRNARKRRGRKTPTRQPTTRRQDNAVPPASWPRCGWQRIRTIRRRWWAVATILIMAVAMGADQLTEALLMRTLTQRLACQTGLHGQVSAQVGGISFLAQAVTGRFSSVVLTARDLQPSTDLSQRAGTQLPAGTRFDLDLRVNDLYIAGGALSLARGHMPDAIGFEHAQANLTLPWETLNALIAQKTAQAGQQMRVRSASGRLAIDTAIPVNGQQFPITIVGEPTIADGSIRLEPTSLQVAGQEIPFDMLSRLGLNRGATTPGEGPAGINEKLEKMSFPLPKLPEQINLTHIDAGHRGLTVRAEIDTFQTKLDPTRPTSIYSANTAHGSITPAPTC
jgi:LmeA-like phospholipid-binding